jgi:CO/xanthine dehydrogenase FAD-binding subunit
MTALPSSACLTSVRFPVWREQCIGVGFHEVSTRRADFALVAAAAQVAVDGDGKCMSVAVGIGAVTDSPLRLDLAKALDGTRAEETICHDAISAVLAHIEPLADLHASAGYRRRAGVTLAVRAVRDAYQTATRGRHAR